MSISFTSYTELLAAMRNDLASGAWRTMSGYSVASGGGTKSITYRSVDDFLKLLDYVETQASLETGPTYFGRTLARSR